MTEPPPAPAVAPTPAEKVDPDPRRQEEEAILLMMGLGQVVGFTLVPIGSGEDLEPIVLLMLRGWPSHAPFLLASWLGIAAMVVSPAFGRITRNRVHLAGTALLALALMGRVAGSDALVFSVLCTAPFVALAFVAYAYDRPRLREGGV